MTILTRVAVNDYPTPDVLGLPDKFQSWRPDQWRAVQAVEDSADRFVIVCAPTGFGKSPAYVASALIEQAKGGRTVILTSTKGLQDQLRQDFEEAGVTVDVRGQNAYPCIISEDGGSVAEGPCHVGYRCQYKDKGCEYYDAVRRAKESPIVVTNYAFWLYANKFGGGLGRVTMLVLDEAHDAPEQLAGFLSTELTMRDAELVGGGLRVGNGMSVAEWCTVGQYHSERLAQKLEEMRKSSDRYDLSSTRRYKDLKKVAEKLAMIAGMEEGHWHAEVGSRRIGWGMKARTEPVAKFDAILPARYAGMLFKDVPKVVLYSATVRPKTAELLGLAVGDYEFLEYPSTFPVASHPITFIPTVRMSHRTTDGEVAMWLARMDQIIGARSDRKGIVHTVSYKRARYIMENSQHRRLMVMHDSQSTAEVVAKFKSSDRPTVLVSPSVTTGYDFPGDQCRYQIIGKIPFPDTKDGVAKVRAELDKDWPSYVAMQTLVQETGRGMRSTDDWCEDFIVDSNMQWFWPKYKGFAPSWWKQLYRESAVLPTPFR